jgi:dTDP-N-acetylfucosamine:lipid II N-acetylfucosaminyltransferase
MSGEYEFAKNNLPLMQATHQFFFYENELPFSQLDDVLAKGISTRVKAQDKPTYVLGNAASPVLNHVDVVQQMQEMGIQANLKVPMGYGFPDYSKFLKKNLSFYTGGTIEFIENYMSFQDYLLFLSQTDGMIMNSVRPQGYGNIFLMQYMNKPVYFNSKNISLSDLNANQIVWKSIEQLPKQKSEVVINKDAVERLLSHTRLTKIYKELFS